MSLMSYQYIMQEGLKFILRAETDCNQLDPDFVTWSEYQTDQVFNRTHFILAQITIMKCKVTSQIPFYLHCKKYRGLQ